MRKKWKKQLFAGILAVAVVAANGMTGFAAPAPDGKTNAADLAETMKKTEEWSAWKNEWQTVKNDWTQISLTPGSDASQLNFAWYSEKEDGTAAPKLRIAEKEDMSDAKEYTAIQTAVEDEADNDGNTYLSNKVTVEGLKENTAYYYCYEKNGSYTVPAKYTTKSKDKFSFIFVGDPQIGSSNELKGSDSKEFYNAQSDSVCSDSFNWENTLNAAMEKTGNQASFVVSAGDQIQTTKKKSPNKDASKSEIEYSGYLSPDILKTLPVATTVGNHDADNANYLYHFNTPNNSELGSNGIVGGDYWFTYGPVLFLMLNTQDTNVAEHKLFMDQAISANPECKWRIVTLHQDIYGSAEHSNEPEITNLRYQLVPYFESNDIDVVLTGHDHAYSRSKMLLGGKSTQNYSDDDFDEQLDKDMDNGDSEETLLTAPENIKSDTTDQAEKRYLDYLNRVMDADAVEMVKTENDSVINPDGILYMTANSSSGSKYYDLVPRMQSYIAGRWQEDTPTYSVVNVDENTFSISTYRTDNNEKIDDTFSISKVSVDKTGLQQMTEDIKENVVTNKSKYTEDSYKALSQAISGAETVLNDQKATNQEVRDAITALTNAKAALAEKTVATSATPAVTTPVVKTTPEAVTAQKAVKVKRVKLKSVRSKKSKKAVVKLQRASGDVDGYEILYSRSKKFKKASVITTKTAGATLKSLKSNKIYYVKARAYKETSNGSIYGFYSKSMKVKVK